MTSELQVLDATSLLDKEHWIEIWCAWPDREVHAHPAYAGLFAGDEDRVLAAVYSAQNGARVLYPFIQRRIAGSEQSDITSPYGYGGPFVFGADLQDADVAAFWRLLDDWAAREGVVSEFVRFSLFESEAPLYPGVRVHRQANIVVPLAQSEEELWRSFESKVRKNVNKARREGVTVSVDTTGDTFAQFSKIYRSTMERRDASAGYLFPAEFFSSIHRDLPGQFAYFHAHLAGVVVSTELVLVSSRSVYSFLGGTLPEAFPQRPNDLLKLEIMQWARAQGKEFFVLGGGFVSGDGIERYKRAFAPGGSRDFFTGQRILDESAYLRLCKEARVPSDSAFFPAYRAA